MELGLREGLRIGLLNQLLNDLCFDIILKVPLQDISWDLPGSETFDLSFLTQFPIKGIDFFDHLLLRDFHIYLLLDRADLLYAYSHFTSFRFLKSLCYCFLLSAYSFLIWCRGRDSNPHSLTTTRS